MISFVAKAGALAGPSARCHQPGHASAIKPSAFAHAGTGDGGSDSVAQGLPAPLGAGIDQTRDHRGRNIAVSAAVMVHGDLAPATVGEPAPELIAHAGLDGHAHVMPGDLGAQCWAGAWKWQPAGAAHSKQGTNLITDDAEHCFPF